MSPASPEVLDVLVVEDTEADARVITRLLSESATPRFRSTVVGTLSGALGALGDTGAPDAVLLDLGLPDGGGAGTLDQVLERTPDATVIVLTVDGREETALDAIRRGAQDYLVKGHFDGAALTRSIRYAISRQASAAALRRSNEALAAFANAAAHDLREPLRTMSGFAQLLELRHADALDEAARGILASITAAGRRGEELIDRLLEYAYSTDGDLAIVPVPLDRALDAALATLGPVVEARGARVTRRGDLPVVRADQVQLEQALRNLIANGVRHNDSPAPEVEVSAEDDGRGHVVTVRDNGRGVAAEDRERIFRSFQRGRVTDLAPGSGLGLALVARVAERHGGRAWVEPADGGGSAFRLLLPG